MLRSDVGVAGAYMKQVNIPIPEGLVRDFCRKWKVAELSVFGSVLREDFRPDSDVDVLVTFAMDAQWSLYDWVDMIAELREIFGRDVDLLSSQSLRNPFRRHEILKTRETVYAT
ncbi:MAG TPA: nucleotidyltransferase family protein [Terriglobia bacterium]|nr:nucleotidyltransferase family protein [Terriglobia bacterium]